MSEFGSREFAWLLRPMATAMTRAWSAAGSDDLTLLIAWTLLLHVDHIWSPLYIVSTSASPFKLAGVKMAAPLSHVLVSGDEGSGRDLVSGQVTAANTACAEASSSMCSVVCSGRIGTKTWIGGPRSVSMGEKSG